MSTNQSVVKIRFKVGLFTLIGLITIAMTTVIVNDRPYWWRSCQLVNISVEDATGLKSKSPVRSLGIDIGFLKSVALTETHVTLGICITAPVEVLPTTRAYIRGEGFLGDKFVELKPVKYIGTTSQSDVYPKETDQGKNHSEFKQKEARRKVLQALLNIAEKLSSQFIANALAEQVIESETAIPTGSRHSPKSGREIPVGSENQDVQQLVTRVNDLVQQMTSLTTNLERAVNPEDLKRTMQQLNQTLANASKTLAPEGGLNQTAQRSLAKLEDAIEQLRDLMTRVNKGEGSVGMLLNDPSYANEIREGIRNLNRLLGRASEIQLKIDVGATELKAYEGGRAWAHLGIWPSDDRYYLIGVASDPRGRISNSTVTTTAGGVSQTVQTQLVDQTGILLTAMLGKIFFKRFDLSAGALYGDGVGSINLLLGPNESVSRIQLRNDFYFRTAGSSFNDRLYATAFPFNGILGGLYFRGGLESFQNYNGQLNYFAGAGLYFTDNDIKLLFSLR